MKNQVDSCVARILNQLYVLTMSLLHLSLFYNISKGIEINIKKRTKIHLLQTYYMVVARNMHVTLKAKSVSSNKLKWAIKNPSIKITVRLIIYINEYQKNGQSSLFGIINMNKVTITPHNGESKYLLLDKIGNGSCNENSELCEKWISVSILCVVYLNNYTFKIYLMFNLQFVWFQRRSNIQKHRWRRY